MRSTGTHLSLPECRRLLGQEGSGLSDDVVEQLRDQLYAVAEFAVRGYERTVADEARLQRLPADDRCDVEERAAILEVDAKMGRSAALGLALQSHLQPEQRKRAKPH